MTTNIFHIMLVVLLASIQRRTVSGQAQTCLPSNQCAFIDCCCEDTIAIVIRCGKSGEQTQNFPVRNINSNNYSTDIYRMRIEGFIFDELPSKAFDGLKIKIIQLINNDLQAIRSDSFEGLSGLEELAIYNNTITRVDENAFEPVRGKLRILELFSDETSNSILTSTIFYTVSELTLNGLKSLNSEWFNNLSSLNYLEIYNSPEISNYPSEGFFTNNLELKKVRILYSNITSMLPVLDWLQNVKDQLTYLSLAYNQIESIPGEIGWFSGLTKLDLSGNNIQTITNTVLRNLTELVELYLSSNRIRSTTRDVFMYNTKLEVAYLDDNQIEEIHDFSESIFLMSYENQNGHLYGIKDYQFDTITKKDALAIYINKNNVSEFGNKTFCSQTDTNKVAKIFSFTIDYESFMRMDLCLLRQMGMRNKNYFFATIDIRNAPPDGDHSQVCNCLYVMFLNQFNIRFYLEGCLLNSASCPTAATANEIANINANCATSNRFTCVYKGAETTTRKVSNGGTIAIRVKSSYFAIIFFFLLIFIY